MYEYDDAGAQLQDFLQNSTISSVKQLPFWRFFQSYCTTGSPSSLVFTIVGSDWFQADLQQTSASLNCFSQLLTKIVHVQK